MSRNSFIEGKAVSLQIYLRIMFQEMELSVSISNQKCRIKILKAVAKLTGSSCTVELHISMINDTEIAQVWMCSKLMLRKES